MNTSSIAALAPIPSDLATKLRAMPARRWLITGCAGFIGSNLVENLLLNNQHVVGVDNFSTGLESNLASMVQRLGSFADNFEFHRIDIRDTSGIDRALIGVDHVCHQAALGSVPRSIKDPIASIESNVTGFNTVLDATRRQSKATFVYASSSSVYGDHPTLPKLEHTVGNPLSPYAGTKAANELFADVFARSYGMHCVGLRYFNVFGPRQDPNGPYAAVIPKWIANMLAAEPVIINGDGSTSRDFCYVANAVQANILASLVSDIKGKHQVYNVACGQRTTLIQLHEFLTTGIAQLTGQPTAQKPIFTDFRAGDVLHSLADISAAKEQIGYAPEFNLQAGLDKALPWYLSEQALISG